MSTFGSLMTGGASPKWLQVFQKGTPGEAGWYLKGANQNAGRSKRVMRLFGPIRDEAHAWVLSSLARSDEEAWPRPFKPAPYGRGASRYDKNELDSLVVDPGAYRCEDTPCTRVELLPVTKLKLGTSEAEALQNLRMIDFGPSGWWYAFRFKEVPVEGTLFPFAADEYTRFES